MSMFTELYQSSQMKYSGDPDESFVVFESKCILNMHATKVHSKEAVSVLHCALVGIAQAFYIQRYGARGFERAEEALAALASHFVDDVSSD